MPLLHLIILAIIQGVTEFLPVSSSAHLILFPALTGTIDQGPIIDVAVHLGTLLAVMLYFHSDVRKIFFGAGHLLKGRTTPPEARFALYLIYATLPAIAVGLMLKLSGVSSAMRENVPGNHFLGTAHTLANFETAFYRSDTADNNSYEQWVEDGSLDASQRANRLWKERLASYQPPALDDAIDAELQEYIAKRKAVLPDTFG